MGIEDLQYMGNLFVAEWTGCPPEVLKKLGRRCEIPELQAPNPNHSQVPIPKPLLGIRRLRPVGLGIWRLGVVGAWDLDLRFDL